MSEPTYINPNDPKYRRSAEWLARPQLTDAQIDRLEQALQDADVQVVAWKPAPERPFSPKVRYRRRQGALQPDRRALVRKPARVRLDLGNVVGLTLLILAAGWVGLLFAEGLTR